MVALREGCKVIEGYAMQDSSPAFAISGKVVAWEASVKASFLEYVMRRLNEATYDTGKALVLVARQRLTLAAGEARARVLMDLMDKGDALNTTMRVKAMRSISLLWTLWASVTAMPYTWLPNDKPILQGRVYQWEISSQARMQLLGSVDACMLVAGFQAYSILPGRVLGDGQVPRQEGPLAFGTGEDGQPAGQGMMRNDVLQRAWSSATGRLMSVQSPQFSTPYTQPAQPVQRQHQQRHASVRIQSPALREAAADPMETGSAATDGRPATPVYSYTSADEAETNEGNEQGSLHEGEWVPFMHPKVSNYFVGKHFASVARHAPVAWDDCMWLLLLQERSANESECNQQPQQQPLADERTINNPSDTRASFSTYDFLDVEINRLARLRSTGDREGGHPQGMTGGGGSGIPGGVEEGCLSTGDTAFGLLEKEFLVMKPFLMYNAVVAANIGRMNLYYMQEQCVEYLNDMAERTGLYPHPSAPCASNHADATTSNKNRKRKLF
jgi:hypothetical protein